MATGNRSFGLLVALALAWSLSGLNLYLSWSSSKGGNTSIDSPSRLSGASLRSKTRVELESHFRERWREQVQSAKDALNGQDKSEAVSPLRSFLASNRSSSLMFSHAHYPAWVHGHWLLVQHHHHGQQKVIDLLHKYMFELHIPVTTVVLDAHWADPTDMFRWDPNLYPHPQEFLKILERDYNVRVVLWLSSLVPVRDRRYEEFAKHGLFLQDRPPGHLGEKHCKPSGASGLSAEVDAALKCPPRRFVWTHGDSTQSIEGSLLDIHLGTDLLPHHNGSLEIRPYLTKMMIEKTGADSSTRKEDQDFLNGKYAAIKLFKDWYSDMIDFMVTYGIDGVRAGAVDSLLLRERHLYSAWGASSSVVKARHQEPLMKKSAVDAEGEGEEVDVDRLEEAKERAAVKERGHKVTREPYAEEYYHQMHLASVLSGARRTNSQSSDRGVSDTADELSALQVDGGVLFARTIDSIAGQRYTHFAPQDVAVAGFSGEQPFNWHGYKETMMHVYQCAYNQYINCGSVIGGTLPFSEDEKKAHVDSLIDPGQYEYLKRNNKHVQQRVESEKKKYLLKEHHSKKAELVQRWAQTTSWLPIFASSSVLLDFLVNSSTPSTVPKTLARSALLHSTFTPFWLALSTSAFNNQLEVSHRDHHLEDPEHFGDVEVKIWQGETKDENQKYADFRKERQKHVEGYLGADLFNDRKAAANVDGFLKSHEMDHRGMSIRPTARDGRIFYDDPLDWSYSLGVGLNQDDIFVVPVVANSFGEKKTKVAITLPHLRHQVEAHVDPEDVAQGGLNHPHHRERHFRASEWVHVKHRQLLPDGKEGRGISSKELSQSLTYVQAGEQVLLQGAKDTLEDSDAVFFRRGALIPRLLTSAILDAFFGVSSEESTDEKKTFRPIALFNPYSHTKETLSGIQAPSQWRYLVMESYRPVQGQTEVFSSPFAANWFEGFEASLSMGTYEQNRPAVLTFTWTSAAVPAETLHHDDHMDNEKSEEKEQQVLLLDHSRVFFARSAEVAVSTTGSSSQPTKSDYEVTCSVLEEESATLVAPLATYTCVAVNSSVLSSQLSAAEPLRLLLDGVSEPSLSPRCWFTIPRDAEKKDAREGAEDQTALRLIDLFVEMPPVLSNNNKKKSPALAVTQVVQCGVKVVQEE